LVKLANSLNDLKLADADEEMGVKIIQEAIQYPARQIATNAGYKGDRVVEEIKTDKNFNHGFNARTGEFADLLKA